MLEGARASVRRVVAAHPRSVVTVASAVLVSVVFQAIAIARNNYTFWSPEFTGIELSIALLASFVASRVRGMDERGEAWASSYAEQGSWLHRLLRLLPAVAARAAILTAALSVVNATVVPMLLYRETVVVPVLAVLLRFLADIPQGFVVCLVVRLLVERACSRERRMSEGTGQSETDGRPAANVDA